MFEALPRPAIFAHRGSSAHAPENTLAAFQLALRSGADAIELDAKLTRDGQVVVIHDQSVDRTTNGHGIVRQMQLAEIRELDAGSYFGIAFQHELIPTLQEVLEAMGGKIFINIELTNYASLFDALPETAAALIKKHALTKKIMFSSFSPIALSKVKRLLPEVPIAPLALHGLKGKWVPSWVGRLLKYQALHSEFNDVTPRLITSMHQHGKRIHAYTVNRNEDMQRMFDLGVDGIITNDPLLARRVLEEHKHSNESFLTHDPFGMV